MCPQLVPFYTAIEKTNSEYPAAWTWQCVLHPLAAFFCNLPLSYFLLFSNCVWHYQCDISCHWCCFVLSSEGSLLLFCRPRVIHVCMKDMELPEWGHTQKYKWLNSATAEDGCHYIFLSQNAQISTGFFTPMVDNLHVSHFPLPYLEVLFTYLHILMTCLHSSFFVVFCCFYQNLDVSITLGFVQTHSATQRFEQTPVCLKWEGPSKPLTEIYMVFKLLVLTTQVISWSFPWLWLWDML